MAIFAKYDGVDGEATDANHDKWIDVLSFDWGAERAGSNSAGQSRRRGSADIEDLVLAIEYEKASPKLLESCLSGRVLPLLASSQVSERESHRCSAQSFSASLLSSSLHW